VLREPIMNVRIVVPESNMGDIMGDLNTRRARVQGMDNEKGRSVITATVPLAEMLRYLRRDVDRYPDSRAAHIELSFLASCGAVDLDLETGQLDWDPERVFAGFSALGRSVIRALRAGNEAETRRLLDQHDAGRDPRISAFLQRAFLRSAHIPHDIGYTYET